MFNLRNETIKAILTELKIDNSPFNIEVVKEFIAHIADAELKAFYMALFKDGAKIFNGLDRVAKIAETFKPVGIDLAEIKAKNLIALIETTNTQLGEEAIAQGKDFVKLVKFGIKLVLPEDDIAILDMVKPYKDHKELIINIRRYQTSTDSLRAFMEAIKYANRYSADAIEYKRPSKELLEGLNIKPVYSDKPYGNKI